MADSTAAEAGLKAQDDTIRTQQATLDPMEAARVLARALTQNREGAWAGYIVRYRT